MYVGQLISTGIVHCGSSFSFFAPALYKYISGCSLGDIDIANDEVLMKEYEHYLRRCIGTKLMCQQ